MHNFLRRDFLMLVSDVENWKVCGCGYLDLAYLMNHWHSLTTRRPSV